MSISSPPTGIGMRAPHLPRITANADLPKIAWLEAHAENFLGGGPMRRHLVAAAARWPISLHAVGLSLGSIDGIDPDHLDRIANLCAEVAPALVSDHLSWSGAGGRFLNDLLPLPYTEESLDVVADNIGRVQDRLRRPLLIENPSTYLRFAQSVIPEHEFLIALAQRSGCRLLLDINNLIVNQINHGNDPAATVAALPVDLVAEMHLAGHALNNADGMTIAIDNHGSVVGGSTWALFATAATRFANAPALIEWDTDIPTLEILQAEADKADLYRQPGAGHVRAA